MNQHKLTNPSLNPHHEARKRAHEERQAAERQARPWRWSAEYEADVDASIHELNAAPLTDKQFKAEYDRLIARLDTKHQARAMADYIRIHEIESVKEASNGQGS